MDDLIERLSDRLATASLHDRQFERPMNWTEADKVLAALRAFAEREKELVEALQSIAKVPRSEAAYAIIKVFAHDALTKHKEQK